MIVWRDGETKSLVPGRSSVAVGVFDGLHRGHQVVLARMAELAGAHGARRAVVTFDPHPARTLRPERAPGMIQTLDQRLAGLERLGVDLVRVVRFDGSLAAETADAFVERVLVSELAAVDIVVGDDFRFGHDRQGSVASLEAAGRAHDFTVTAVPSQGEGARWSSTGVRAAISSGDLARAAAILGRPLTWRAIVVSGDRRGRELGFPTANLDLPAELVRPPAGVYAGLARLPEGAIAPAAISIGRRPQFYEDGPELVEVHLIDREVDLYDQVLEVALLARLRGQERFADLGDLLDQMRRDTAASREMALAVAAQTASLLGWDFGQRR